MPSATPILRSFNAGEWSSRLDGRVDLQKYGNACKVLENFLVGSIGCATRRSGTRFVKEVKTSANRTWLAKFQFNASQAYILEFGNLYIRFYTSRANVESSPGVPLEVTTPYSTSDLTASDGTFNLQMVQSGDVIYLLHPSYQPRKLTRVTATSWTIGTVDFVGGPFEDVNTTATTVSASAQTGAVVLTASASIFTANHVGGLFYLEGNNASVIPAWEVGKVTTAGQLCRSDGNIYKALNNGTTGSIKPTHKVGSRYDGSGSVKWEYQHSGYGWCKITGYTSGTQVNATVLSLIPDEAVSSASTNWAFGSFSNALGWPTHCAFSRSRLWILKGNYAHASVSSDFENFSAKDGAEVTADMAIRLPLVGSSMDNVQWAAQAGQSLLVGTEGGEFAINAVNSNEPLSASNAQPTLQTGHGGRSVAPLMVDGDILFVQRSGSKLRDLAYSFEKDGFVTSDTTLLSDHITRAEIVDMAMQLEPDRIAWCVMGDGSLGAFTFNKEQEVQCWARHVLGGSGIVEAVETIPAPDKSRDDVWLIVRRTINGSSKRYIEYIESDFTRDTAQADAFFVDCGLTYSGAPATTISGLGHLEGATLDVLADGATHPQVTVASGAVTLARSASKVHLGYNMVSRLQTMRIEAGAGDGTAQGKIKRIHQCVVRFDNTLGGFIGGSFTTMDAIQFRSGSDPMDSPPPLFSGDKIVKPFPNGYDRDGYICIKQSQPLPMTVLAIIPQLVTQDG